MNKEGKINAIAAIAGISLLAAWALYLGFDGILFLTAIGIVSGLGGYPVAKEIASNYGNIGKAIKEFEKQR